LKGDNNKKQKKNVLINSVNEVVSTDVIDKSMEENYKKSQNKKVENKNIE